jgi:hypothetical protein
MHHSRKLDEQIAAMAIEAGLAGGPTHGNLASTVAG